LRKKAVSGLKVAKKSIVCQFEHTSALCLVPKISPPISNSAFEKILGLFGAIASAFAYSFHG
jgi:hypothetical protein